MPGRYGRRYSKRSKLSRRGFRKSRSLRKQVRRVQRAVKKLNSNIETKAVTIPGSLTGVQLGFPSDPTTLSPNMCLYLPVIGEGDEINQRVGRQISIKHLNLKFDVRWVPQANNLPSPAQPNVRVRVLLFWDKNTGSPTSIPVGDLLDGLTSSSKSGDAIYAPINWNNRKRFKIIMDKIYHIPQITWQNTPTNPVAGYNTVAASPASMIVKKKYIKLNRKIYYKDNGNTVTSGYRNGLWLYAFAEDSDVAAGQSSQMFLRYNYRFTFTDS